LFNSSYPEKNKITRLAGVISLSEKTEVMKKLLFGIIILFHAGIFALLTSFTWHHLSLWIWLLLIWMLGYTENSFLVSVGFVESAILFAYATVLWPLIPVKTIITAFLVLMVCGTILRKEKIEKKWYPDIIFILHFSIAMFFLIKGGFFHPFSLLIIAGFAGCYVSVPDRPVNHGKALIYLWPLLSGVFVFCIFRKFSAGLFGLWAMINFILPCIFYSFFSSNRGMDIWQRNGWMMIGNALEKRDFFLKNQSYGSLFLIIVSGIILGSAGIVSVLWIIPVLFTLTVFIYRNMNLAFEKKSIFHAMQAEWGIIGFLFLLRTYIAIKGLMGWTSAMDVYLLLGVAFICAGIRELMKREIPEISIHLDRSMNFYAIAGWIYSLILRIFYGVGFVGIAGSVVLSILYYWQGKVKNRSQLIVSAVMANIAVLFWFSDLAFTNALFYVCPVAISMSVLAQMFRNRLTIAQLYNIRLASSLSMLGTATAYHVLEFQGSYIMPLVASIIAITGAVIGIALQIRIYLYSGTAFFFFNAITLLVHVITKQPAGHIKLIAGVAFLIIGILLTASFLIFQMKRQMILDKIEALKLELQGWE
jgi:hypothetical protein